MHKQALTKQESYIPVDEGMKAKADERNKREYSQVVASQADKKNERMRVNAYNISTVFGC